MSVSPMYLTRVCLRRNAPASALRAILTPDGRDARVASTHRLVWTLFSDSPDRRRDFLWRETEPGTFYCLSSRVPDDHHGLFEVEPPKLFELGLGHGDRLRFLLRVNATVSRGGQPPSDGNPGARGKPHDIVMDALHGVAKGERAGTRRRLLVPVAHEWLSRQGEKHGFSLEPLSASETDDGWQAESFNVQSYRVLAIDRGRGRKPMNAGVLDIEGELLVREPEVFERAVHRGFGRAKAFGCGLMLLRRA
jgi:CRISPR system Cascade subunit CasE